MNKPKHHLFVCGSFRVAGEARGICYKKDSHDLLSYLQSEIQDRMLDGVEVASTGCMNICDKGPVMIDYPSGHWYANLSEEAIDAILDAFEADEVCETYRIA